jgi:hypothetical protein
MLLPSKVAAVTSRMKYAATYLQRLRYPWKIAEDTGEMRIGKKASYYPLD